MKDVRVRILYPPSVTAVEVSAAAKGVERFRKFGVLHDHAEVGKNSDSIRGVRNGRTIRRIITSPNPSVSCYGLRGGLSEIFFTKDILALGLTPSRIVEIIDDGSRSETGNRLGIARDQEGAIVSLFRIRRTGEQFQLFGPSFMDNVYYSLILRRAIEIAAAHELGHAFGLKGHCDKEGCIMQENKDYEDFIGRFVMLSVDLCQECSSFVRNSITRRMYTFLG